MRRALDRLAQKRLVAHVPNRGYHVYQPDGRQEGEVVEIRILLETGVAGRIVTVATETDIALLERLACPFNEVLESKNAFYLVCHDSQAEVGKIAAFRQWILTRAASEQEMFRFRYGATQPMAPLHGTLHQ